MKQEASRLLNWMSATALPFWSTRGVDLYAGGFIERVEPDGTLVADVRRARLVARQIYVFRIAGDFGWKGNTRALVDHGLAALRRHHIGADDVAIPRYHLAKDASEGEFDLYDQAFVLFGLAHGFAVTGDSDLEAQAERILARMREGWQHPLGGFADHRTPQPPLRANPHMHLLEAALAWLEEGGGAPWRDLAAEIADLCLNRFIAPDTGALHEYYDAEWRRDASLAEEVVEPGHQAEWSWLLMRWAARSGDSRIEPVASRLLAIAEDAGLNAAQSRLINELEADLSPKWRWMRLWPQTERIKALVLFARRAANDTDRAALNQRIGAATASLLDFIDHPIPGCWWEHLDEEGKAVHEPTRASSLYHLMGAAAELGSYVKMDLAPTSAGG